MKFHLKFKMRINIPFLFFIFAKPHTHTKRVLLLNIFGSKIVLLS